MGVSTGQNSGKNFRNFKLVSKTTEKLVPYISETVRQSDGSYAEEGTYTEIEGLFTRIDVESKDFGNGETFVYKLYFDDGDDIMILNSFTSSLLYDILNKLSCDEADFSKPIKISVYRKEVQGKKDNKTYYNGLSAIKNSDSETLYPWGVEFEKIPAVQSATVGKKVVYDSSEKDEFFATEVVNKIRKNLGEKTNSPKAETAKETQPVTKTKAVKQVEVEEEEDDDNLPF